MAALDQTPEPPEEKQEKDFRRFIRRLLDAERYELLEVEPFSLWTLRKTFCAFCDFISEEIGTESCTIHLQLYDPASLNDQDLEGDSRRHLQQIAKNYGFSGSALDAFKGSRGLRLKTSQTFPYWRYPKGASVLFASNREGPWGKVAIRKRHLVATLDHGISKDIYQQNIARIRDQLTIQSSRGFRKLGGADPYVWVNGNWDEIFRNYYGVPIRIHSLGEAIGILKVENKKQRFRKGALEQMLATTDVGVLREGILEHLGKRANGLRALHASLLALVYLLEDLSRPECREALGTINSAQGGVTATFRDLIFLPFPHIDYRGEPQADETLAGLYPEGPEKFKELSERQETEQSLRLYGSLRPMSGYQQPPVQIFAGSIREERDLWKHLEEYPVAGSPPSGAYEVRRVLSNLVSRLTNLCKIITDKLIERDDGESKPVELEFEKRRYSISFVQPKSPEPEERLPDFLSQFKLCFNGKEIVTLLAIVLPTPAKVNDPGLAAESGEISWQDYRGLNSWWCGEQCSILESLQHRAGTRKEAPHLEVRGEQVRRKGPSSPWVTDLVVDRLAARAQALARALATAKFTPPDTRKLSWAALEIGKVLERQIAYRASYLPDPIPLTAMEFFRIPISHLGFVDDLQRRRQECEAVEDDVRRRLRQIVVDFGWRESVRDGSRVKDYRSYLTRLGERYEGFIRGNMALGLFLLALRLLPKDGESKIGQETQQAEGEGPAGADRNSQAKAQKARAAERVALLNDLEELKKEVLDVLVALCGKAKTDQLLAFFPKNRVLGDFRFRTAPITLQRKEDREEALKICIENLCNEGCLQGDQADPSEKWAAWAKVLEGLVRDGGVEKSLEARRNELESLLFRRYDSFAQATYSLLCQLANCLYCNGGTGPEGYLSFYRICYDLKARLSLSTRAMEEEAELASLKEFFAGEAWTRLVEFVDSRETTEFVEIIGEKVAEEDVLFLNSRGLYKRVRMMHHVLRLHISPSSLEWALGRFDLVGCRATALFKHQVFAVAEYLWNRGDPFFDFTLDAKDFAEFSGPKTRVTAPPWLCLRTKVFEDEYQAVHLAALVDPATVGEQVIRKRVYSPQLLREYLESRLCPWEKEFAKKYRNYAYHRNRMRLEYTQWAGSGNSGSTTSPGEETGRPAPPFLFEGVIEILIRVLREIESAQECATDLEEAVRELLWALVDVLGWAEAYTIELRKGLVQEDGLLRVKFDCTAKPAEYSLCQSCQSCPRSREGTRDELSWLQPRTCQIYLKAKALLGKIGNRKGGKEDPDGSRARKDLERYLDQERSSFEGLRAKDRVTPLLFVPPPDTTKRTEESGRPARSSLRQELKDLLGNGQAEQKEQGQLPPAEKWADLLVRLQRQYTTFFFEQGSAPEQASPPELETEGGLWLRDAGEVLGRIENYVLLFSPGQLRKKREPHAEQPNESNSPPPDPGELAGWTAYDLFHYFHSLIPVEIQVRTQLANTVAEQYHEPLYKGQPGLAAELGGRRVKNLSRQLGDWDREMDRVYLGVQRQAQVTPSHGKTPEKKEKYS